MAGAVILWLILTVVKVLGGGVVVMLTAGMLHHEVFPQLPPWSFGQSLAVSIGLTVVGFYFQNQASSGD